MVTLGNVATQTFAMTTTPEIQAIGVMNNTTRSDMSNVRLTNTFIKVAYVSISSVGILGNLIVIMVISRSSMMRKTYTNVFILNQSCIDFMASCCIMLTTTTRTSVAHDLSGIVGEIYCRFWLSDLPLWSFLISSSYTLIVLTIERYIAIVYPLFHYSSCSKTSVLVLAIAAWFPGLIYMLGLLVPTSGVIDGRCYVMTLFASPAWKKVCGVMLFICQYLIPITVFVTCYSRIFVQLRSRVAPQTGSTGNEAVSLKARARRNVLKTLVIIVICYILCNSWNQFTFLAFNFGYPVDFTSAFYNFTVIAMFANSCINPIIYALKYETFQNEARRFFRCGKNTTISTTT